MRQAAQAWDWATHACLGKKERLTGGSSLGFLCLSVLVSSTFFIMALKNKICL